MKAMNQTKGKYKCHGRGFRPLSSALGMATLLCLLNCPQGFPQEELAEARLQLAAAQEEGAPTAAPQEYKEAREKLLNAHQLIADEEFSDAKESAEQSAAAAIAAREKAMPAYLAKLLRSAEAAVRSMEEKNVNEIAPEDFQLAKTAYESGRNFQQKGDNSKERAAVAKDKAQYALRRESLGLYRNAALSYKEIQDISLKIEKVMKARGLDIGDALKAARAEMEKARRYGATRKQLQGPQTQLTQAEKDYAQKRYDMAGKKVEDVRKTLAALILQLEPVYAREMLARGRAAVAKARARYRETDTPQERQNEARAKVLDAMKEQVAAAYEAKEAAENFLSEENYIESIKESEDAIRLSQVVLEQAGLVATGRKGIITSDGNGLVEDIGGGWKRYTVRAKKPADCLWCIAVRPEVYGNGTLWKRIHRYNRSKIKNPNLIYPSQVLLIPPREGDFSGGPPASNTNRIEEEVEPSDNEPSEAVQDGEDDADVGDDGTEGTDPLPESE